MGKRKEKGDAQKAKKTDFLNRLSAQKKITKKPKKKKDQPLSTSLATLKDLLPSLEEDDQVSPHLNSQHRITPKQKATLINDEKNHFKAVINHPAYKEDPLAAIQLHLKNFVEFENSKVVKRNTLQNQVNQRSTVAAKKQKKKKPTAKKQKKK